jgi:hypothetical protein
MIIKIDSDLNKVTSDCRYNGHCDYRTKDKPWQNEKELLINGLHRQVEIMESNAAYLHKLYPYLNHHVELLGAAKITQEWIDNIYDN